MHNAQIHHAYHTIRPGIVVGDTVSTGSAYLNALSSLFLSNAIQSKQQIDFLNIQSLLDLGHAITLTFLQLHQDHQLLPFLAVEREFFGQNVQGFAYGQ